jgi:uncharacterized protein
MTLSVQQQQRQLESPTMPWWRVRMLWLVVGAPLVMVVLSLALAVVAVRGADPVLSEGQLRLTADRRADAQTPALMARNHAATAGPTSSDMTTPLPAKPVLQIAGQP